MRKLCCSPCRSPDARGRLLSAERGGRGAWLGHCPGRGFFAAQRLSVLVGWPRCCCNAAKTLDNPCPKARMAHPLHCSKQLQAGQAGAVFLVRKFKESTVYNVAQQFTTKSKAGLDAWKSVVNASFDGIGKLAALNLHTARAVAKQGAENFKALSDVRDMEGLKALQKPMAIAAVSQSVAFSRRAYHISNESSSAVVQVLGSQLSQAGRGAVGAFQEAKKNTPPGLDFAVSSGKALLSSATSMFANLTQVAKPATEVSAKPAVKMIAKTA